MNTYTAIGWRMGRQARLSHYIVIHDVVFNIEENTGIDPTVFLTCAADANAARAYAIELTRIDESGGLTLKGHMRSAEVTVDLEALMATYVGGATPMGEDLEDVLSAVINGTKVN